VLRAGVVKVPKRRLSSSLGMANAWLSPVIAPKAASDRRCHRYGIEALPTAPLSVTPKIARVTKATALCGKATLNQARNRRV